MSPFRRRFPGHAWLLAALAAAIGPRVRAQDTWAVPGAELRIKVEDEMPPTSPDAGRIVFLPNAGALPGPFPNATVLDASGHVVHSECLWNNPDEGCAFIIPDGPGPFWIYLSGASSPSGGWTPDSPLHPSLLLYTRVGDASLEEARNLAEESPPAQAVRMGQVPMIADEQNRFGSSDDFVSYYTGWINVPASGDIFIGTISQDGSTVLIDGATTTSWPGVHSFQDGLTGKRGNTVKLTAGSHHIEYFQFASGDGSMAELIWRLPGANKELPEVPAENDFVHSGTLQITSIESHNGVPPALFERTALSYMNFANQFVDLYELRVPLSDQYTGASLDWSFSDGAQAHGPDVFWPHVRGTPLSVTLTAGNTRGSSSGTRRIEPDTLPEGAKVDDPAADSQYTQALLNTLRGAPTGVDAARNWPPAFWEMLPQIVQDNNETKDLLAFLFQNCQDDLDAALSADDREHLADLYYGTLAKDTGTALPILQKIIASEKDLSARFQWQLKEIDFLLYETGDIAAARQTATALTVDVQSSGQQDAELRLIALGDVERMAGNGDAATKYYTDAQNLLRNAADNPMAAFAGFETTGGPQPASTPQDGIVIGAAANSDADWRKRIVEQNSYYTEVKNLVDQDALTDARDKLQAWALDFPLAKLGGDYALAEAEIAEKVEDYARARRILKAYRQRVDISSEMAEVMQEEWQCVAELQQPDEIKELAADIVKRFPDLPLAKEAQKALQGDLPKPLVGQSRPLYDDMNQAPSPSAEGGANSPPPQ
ncbi:MAG: hypothetical protein ABSE62_14750 [Chthoniobacteraceae bacterium]|jgi:TolA-binding protein